MPVRIDANPNADRVYNTTPAQTGQSNTRNIMSIAEFNKANPNNKWNSNVGAVIQTSSGKQYTLDKQTYDWVTSRYKQDWAGSYGLDDADQYAQRNGQMSAAVRNTYNASGIDQDLMRLGLPSQKNLEKYLEGYQKWHTGGMDQYFSQMNLPKNYWTNVKGWYQSDMQNAYENTAEDQQRKARGLMPSKWEAKYTDTEIDDQLRARGLPPISEFNTYAQRWDNYQGIENFYANVALNETNLRLAGVKDDDTKYPYNGDEYTGHDLYTMAFFDELDKKNEDGSYVYAPIRSMFKNGTKPTSSTSTGDYAYDRGAAITAANKEAANEGDYANYTAFSYDDYKSKYDDLYNRYFANAQTGDGQLVSDVMAMREREADEEATRSFYDPTNGNELAFIQQWRKENPNGTFEDMAADMLAHGSPVSTVRRVEREARAKKNIEAVTGNKNYREDGWGWYDISNGFTKAVTAADKNKKQDGTSFISAAEASYEKEPSNVKEPEMDGGWVFPEEQTGPTFEEVRTAANMYRVAEANNDRSALYDATQALRGLGLSNFEAAETWLRDYRAKSAETVTTKNYYSPVGISKDELGELTTEDAARIVEYYMEENGGWNSKNAADAFSYLRGIGVQDDIVTNTARDMQARYGNLPEAAEETAYEKPEREATVRQGVESANEYIDATLKEQGEDEATIDATKNAIQNTLATIIDENESVDVDTVLSVLDQVSKLSSTNYTAMKNALEDLGFSYGVQDDWAGDITAGWSDEDLKKLQYGLFDYMSGITMSEPKANDKGGYITEKVADELGDGWVGDHFVQNKVLDTEKFEAAVEWAQQQIASGERTEWEAYQVLAAMGLQNEMQTYMPDEWHRAHYIENVLPNLWAQAKEQDRLLYEAMSPEEQRNKNIEIWNALSDKEKAAIYDSPYWWEADPNVYRTFGQSFQQQMKMVLPGLAAEIVSTPVKIADAIGANISGRPEMWDSTQWLMNLQSGIAQYGSTYDNVNGSAVASTVADVAQELGRMYWYGTIGGAIGAGFAGTSAGTAVMAGSASNSAVVRGASKMFMSMVSSSPFVASAFANNYAEVKQLGASNSEATWFALITGLSEGLLEGFNFDELWGKALGQGNFAKQLALGKHTYLQNLGIVGKAWVSSAAVSGLGEFTEESIGYVLETFLKMRHSDTWGKGTDWNASDWLQQAMMGFITGALGGGIAAGSSFVKDGVNLSKALRDNPSLQAALPDIITAYGEAKSMPDAALDAYRKGGATVLSRSAYGQLITEIENNNKGIENYENTIRSIETKRQKAIGDAKLEVDKLASKIAPYESDSPETAPTLPGKVANKEYAPLKAKLEAAKQHLDYVTNNMDPEEARQLKEAKSKLQNSLVQKESLAKQEQEHWAGLYLQNEGFLESLSEDMITNLAQAYQNGSKYEPAKAQTEEKPSKLAEAEANDTMAEAEQAAKSTEDAATKARELAYNRVYKDQEAGKAYAEGRRRENDSKLTRVEFAENERQNFQAKTTAKLRRVTLELAGLEAKDGMSAKEIFAEAKKAMTPEAAQKLDMYQKLSKALGLDMVIRDVVAGTSGYVHDGKLYVTLNGKQSMLRVASHELTHYMKDHANEQYDALRNHLVNEVGQEEFDRMLTEKAQEYGLDLNNAKARMEADDEVCATLCEKMLESKDALEKFVQSDLDAAKTLKARLGKTLVAIKSAIRSIGTSDAQTKADLIKEQQTIETWYKGLSDAIDNANKAGKSTATTEAETATVTDTTTEAPQAPPVETNSDLFMGEESAKREQLRTDLEELAKKGTKVNGVSYQEVNDVLDRVILGDKSNYNKADYAQIRGMLAQLIPEVTAYVNGDASVDANALNERVSAALDYMLDKYSEGSEDYYNLRDLIPSKIALTDTAYKDLRAKDMTLRQASNELTKALGGKFVNFVYKKAPDYNNAMTIDELWQTITDQYGEQNGAGNVSEDALALIDYVNDHNSKSSFDDLYGSQREDMVNAQVGEFLDAVQNMVEGKNAEQSGTRYYLDEDKNRSFVQLSDDEANTLGGDLEYNLDLKVPPRLRTAFGGMLTQIATDARNGRLKSFYANGNMYVNIKGYGDYDFRVFDQEGDYGEIDRLYDNADTRSSSRENGQGHGSRDGESLARGWNRRAGSFGQSVQDDASVQRRGYSEGYDRYTQNSPEEVGYSIDDDYLPLAERYDAGIATNAEIDKMRELVDEAAYAAGLPSARYALVVYDEDGNVVPLAKRAERVARFSLDNDLVEQYGAIEQGREPRARDVQVPKQTNDTNRVSQWIRSLVESGKLTDDQAQNVMRMVVEQDYGTYVPTSQAERMEEARAYIAERQPLQAQQEFHDMVMQGKFGVKTNALGIQLLSDASARGDFASVLDIAADLQLAATEAGQSAQIFNVLKELKGVGSAWYMQKVIDRMNVKYADRIKSGKMQKITVDQDLMANLAKATTVDQMAAAEEAVAKDIARQLPLTWDDRLSSWRYFSMLANPTTHIRNITGNLLMKGLNTAKDITAIGVQRAAEKLGLASESDRAHAWLTSEDKNTWKNWVQQSYEEQARNLSGGSKLGFESFVKQNMRSFDTKWLNALAQFNFNALEGEDIAFIRPAYKNALMQYMVAQGYTLNEKGQAGKVDPKGQFHEMSKAQMNEAIDWASQQAWKQTFRDASSLATMLNKLSKENAVSRLLVEGVMPFKKTPINIAKRGVDYSPAGIIKGIAQLTSGVKKGKVSTAQAIDTLSSGLTGSALMALGVMLAKMGVIRAGGEKDKKLETYLEDTGDQTYAVKFGNKSINMSSIAPATIPLFMGVALNEMIEQGGDSLDLSTITDTIAGTLNPFMEMSFMSSLNSALKNYNANGIGGALGSTLLTAAQNYGSQYLPTLGGKIAQFLDPTQRTTKSDATSPVGGNLDYYGRSLLKKVPGLEATLQPDVNVWGQTNTKDSFVDWALDFANKFILPTNVKVTNRDAVDNELIRVVESTGVTDFLPSDGNKYFTVNKQKYTMNAKQYTEYSQERGQAAYAALKDTMASASYKQASDEDKAALLKKALDNAYKVVNNQWKEKLGAYDK